MKIDSFKQVLLKKTAENSSLQSFIYHMRDDYLSQYIQESLEKMAKRDVSKNPNALVLDFANRNLSTSGKWAKMMYDHLSHHATRYKAALKSGNSSVANQHMLRIFKNLHLIDKITRDGSRNHAPHDPDMGTGLDKHSTDWVDTKPWERNLMNKEKDPSSAKYHPSPYHTDHYTRDTKGLALASLNHSNFGFLQQSPHFSYADEIHGHGHAKAWPLEETKINGKHIHIDDNHVSKGSYEPHPFDEHPVLNSMYIANKDVGERESKHYSDKAADFMEKHFRNYKTMHSSNPDIGSAKSVSAHRDVEPLDYVHHLSIKDPSFKRTPVGSSQPAKSSPVAAPASAPTEDSQLSLFDQTKEPEQMSFLPEESGKKV
jgi:hypothetical protein